MVDDSASYPTAVSLFTGAGIGDLGLRAAGFDFVVMNEVDPPRAELAQLNFPDARVVVGDIWEVGDEIAEAATARLQGRDLDLVSCTAPCQGMSKNGQGTLLRNIRLGKRPKLDPRNRLILPALDLISRLRPRWVVFENVTEMATTLIEDTDGEIRSMLEVVEQHLPDEYVGKAHVVEFADYGVPQRRQRLITVYSRTQEARTILDALGSLLPPPTHSQSGTNLQAWVTLEDVLGGFPPLDARDRDSARSDQVPFHRVPLLDERKYLWVSHTPPGASAFDNQCVECGFDGNPSHGSGRGEDGINRARTDTPISCLRCSALLPRPHVLEDGRPRIMRGYTSAYKRMPANQPAPTLTRNLSYACSDHKVHPTQNRVLSLAEAFAVHSLSRYEFEWGPIGPKRRAAKDGLIRLVLGESIPPLPMELFGTHWLGAGMEGVRSSEQGGTRVGNPSEQLRLPVAM